MTIILQVWGFKVMPSLALDVSQRGYNGVITAAKMGVLPKSGPVPDLSARQGRRSSHGAPGAKLPKIPLIVYWRAAIRFLSPIARNK